LEVLLPVRPDITTGTYKTPVRRESAALPQLTGLSKSPTTEPRKALNISRYKSIIKRTCSVEMSSASRILGKQGL